MANPMKALIEQIKDAHSPISEAKKFRNLIPHSQREVLAVLCENPKSATKEISQRLNKPYQQIARDLKSLEQKGIVSSEMGRRRTRYFVIKEEYLGIVLSMVVGEYIQTAYESQIKRILSDNTLTSEQKEMAIQKFDKEVEEKLPKYLGGIMKEAIEHARELR